MTQRRKLLSRVDDRSPCIIGVARHTWREDLDGTPEPLRMWAAMAREAGSDSHARNDVIAAIDDVGVVHCQSWQYDCPADRLAQVLDLQPRHRNVSILAGTSPQRLLNAAAERMLKGASRLALVVGGEALATRKRLSSSGEQPPWSFADPDPKPSVDEQEWFLPTELAHGVLPAWLTFGLLDQARGANSGWQFVDYRQACAQTMQRCNAVAAGNPHAWFPQPYTAKQIADPSPDNRWIAGPYTKRMTAFMDVDMAAGILMATHGEADRLEVPPERRIYFRGWAFARDATHLAARAQLDASAAMRVASQAAMDAAGIGIDDVAVFDLYSCFPAALHFAMDALGLSADETRSLTATGGLPYHGGPSSNYMSHSIGHVVDLLRQRPGEFGLVSGIGMHMTKHVYACYSSDPGPVTPPDYQALQAAADHPERRVVDVSAPSRARVATSATIYSRDGHGESLLAICELPDGSRAYARTTEPEALAALAGLDWRERSVVLRPGPRGTNLLTPEARLS